MKGTRILLAAALLAIAVALSGCGSTVAARCETRVAIDGSGTRVLSFTVPKQSTGDSGVDFAALSAKLRKSTPSFAGFSDASNTTAYVYRIVFDFKGAEDLGKKARWFGASVTERRTGAVFSPAIEWDETFDPQKWFQWALDSAGRTSSDISSVDYVLELPGTVVVREGSDPSGSASGSTYTLKPGYGSAAEIRVSGGFQHDVATVSVSTRIEGDGTASRRVAYGLSKDTAAKLEKELGGTTGIERALEGWAGKGWTFSSSDVAGGREFVLERKASANGVTVVSAESAPPALSTAEGTNAYVARRTFTESFDVAAWMPGDVTPAKTTYELQLPWQIQGYQPTGNVDASRQGTLRWTSGAGSLQVRVDLAELKGAVLYPVSAALLALSTLALLGVVLGLMRILLSKPVPS